MRQITNHLGRRKDCPDVEGTRGLKDCRTERLKDSGRTRPRERVASGRHSLGAEVTPVPVDHWPLTVRPEVEGIETYAPSSQAARQGRVGTTDLAYKGLRHSVVRLEVVQRHESQSMP